MFVISCDDDDDGFDYCEGDPMGKMFQNASSLKPNCPGMIIGRSFVFYADRKSKMAATTGHSINTGPYGENTEIYSSLKLLH